VTVEKTLTYHEICPFSINYESVMFYSTGPRVAFSHVDSGLLKKLCEYRLQN